MSSHSRQSGMSMQYVTLLAVVSTLAVAVSFLVVMRTSSQEAGATNGANGALPPTYVEVTPTEQELESGALQAPFVRRSDGRVGISVTALEDLLSSQLQGKSFHVPCGWQTRFLWELHAKLTLGETSFRTDLLYYPPHYWQRLGFAAEAIGEPPSASDKPEVFLGRYAALELMKAGIKLNELPGKSVNLTLALPASNPSQTGENFPIRLVSVPALVTGVAARGLDNADKHGRLKTAEESGEVLDASWIGECIVNWAWLEAAAAEAVVAPPESLFVYSLPHAFRFDSALSEGAFAQLSRYDERKALLDDYRITGKSPVAVEDFVFPVSFKIRTTQMSKGEVTELVSVLEGFGLNVQAVYPRADPFKGIERLMNKGRE